MDHFHLLTQIQIRLVLSSTTGICELSSQEVIWGSSVEISWNFVLLWSRVELKESVFHELVNLHDGGFVSASVAIIRG